MTLLTAKSISKTYREKVAVNHIDLTVKEGQLIAFLGPNGAGKSTTINMLTGLIQTTSGEIRLAGLDPKQKEYHHKIGVVFQNSVLDGQLTVQQNIQNRARMYKNIDLDFENQLIDDFGLTTILDQRYDTLSGGQRRRVDIARALVHQPDLLFLDEPSTGLDIQTRKVIWGTLEKLRETRGLTIILTTHYLEEAEEADFVYVIDHGEVIAHDTVKQLKEDYAQNLLTIESENKDAVLAEIDLSWSVVQEKGSLLIKVPNEHDAIDFLQRVEPLITHFEFRHGNMDDIFMALTGKEIR
ncbi:ABC transporter ATP-binding protein [Dellaglioa algida]|uniref:ABC transporter ATP-binding protein n=1 Tax=Dellaglioa algida TaxID=105612 RepID=A0A5C6MCN9_9LACO|nr:ABC transporter ATP-binding protein [Dellaglioa algida]MDK1716239.1 ABC transporter ATP-binding protein [Dellaglioa algida]MDK1719520.1 ABC transporter ATP-binding protein [Dellaglioa algida]MDK1720978.1 ABC transporter ATP-binding protein [Dellaglioa algida]MDK1722863.1 ABC transporter ATP-binding protein [Dellaglioa algida]MDK1724482.1 ABC transporter ATP-binding protein [Dellaglioa algida]